LKKHFSAEKAKKNAHNHDLRGYRQCFLCWFFSYEL